jgi:hypothetical protein
MYKLEKNRCIGFRSQSNIYNKHYDVPNQEHCKYSHR